MLEVMKRLMKSTRGAAMPLIAGGMIPALAAIGSGIDYGRLYVVKTRLQTGVDAAALAGARAYAVDDGSGRARDAQAQAYFDANYPDEFMGSTGVKLTKSFTKIKDTNVTEMTGVATLPMSFMQIFGVKPMEVSATASAELQPHPLEVMMVLDNTGSMQTGLSKGRTRMMALKEAVGTFLDVIHQGSTQRPDVAIGMVTYDVTTNVGAILQKYNVAIAPSDGFTNVGNYSGSSSTFPSNPLAWKGCVNDDATIRDVSSNVGFQDPGAWDVTRTLPGEKGNPPVTPYHYMPNMASAASYRTTATYPADYRSDTNSSYLGDGRKNNLYHLGTNTTVANRLANTPAYRQHFYDMYIGLNANPNSADDVIVRAQDGGPFVPGSSTAWRVEYTRIPFYNDSADWAQPNPLYGYPINRTTPRNGYTLWMSSPNFQCPEPALEMKYGRSRSEYNRYVDESNYPVVPAYGTLHHIGMLWGYRLLVRDDVFKRDVPTSIRPKRALVFMTDGESVAGNFSTFDSAYGPFRARRISSSATSQSAYQEQVMRRFSKVCEAAKSENVEVYIIGLTAAGNTETAFRNCAGQNYYQTNNTDELRLAFEEVATDLIDLHLVK